MYAIIVGCGRVGSMLAAKLSARGHNVVIIDSDEEKFQMLGRHFTGETSTGDGMDINVLKTAGISKADAVIMATNDDNSNLLGAQIARKMFGVKRVIVRIKDPDKFSVYKEYALEMVSATTLAAGKIADMLSTPEEIEIIGSTGKDSVKIARISISSESACRVLSKLISNGVFFPMAVTKGENTTLGFNTKDLVPGDVVVGGILTENLKHLNKCCAEES
jgi:trk system potassium uptake protein